MRKTALAVLTAAAVVLGLGMSAGAAYAGTGKHCEVGANNQNCKDGTDINPVGGISVVGGVTVAPNPPVDPRHHGGGVFGHPGGRLGHNFGFLPGGFPQQAIINNNLLNLQLLGLDGVVGVNSVNVCSYPTWSAFDGYYNGRYSNRWGAVRGHFGPNPAAVWSQLYAQANCQAAVANQLNGLQLLNGNLLNLSQYGVVGGTQVSICSYPATLQGFQQFDSFGSRRWGGAWGGFHNRYFGGNPLNVWSHLRTQAVCNTPVVAVQPEQNLMVPAPAATVDPAPAAVPTVDPAPAVSPKVTVPAPVDTSLPAGGIETGDAGLAVA